LALQSHTGYGTPDITAGTQVFDYSPVLLASLRLEEAWIAHCPIGKETQDVVAYWEEDSLVGNQVTTTATLATGGVTLTASTADLTKVGYNATAGLQRVGAVLQVISGPGGGAAGTPVDNGEQVQITAFPSATTATITRAYGLTADPGSTYPSGAVFKLVGWPLPENSGLGPDQTRARTIRYNFVETFGRDITITRHQALRQMQTIDDEMRYQISQRAIEMKREMNDAALFGSPSGTLTGTFPISTGAGDNRTMAGLLYFLRQAGGAAAGATLDSTAEALTAVVLNNLVFATWKLGASPRLIVVGGKQERVIQGFGDDKIRIVPDTVIREGFRTLFRTDVGPVLKMVVDGNMSNGADGSVAIVDQTRIALRPFTQSQFFLLTAPTLNDGDSARLLADWTFECRNAVASLQAHALHTALTIPA
jgi:hypothetical protein